MASTLPYRTPKRSAGKLARRLWYSSALVLAALPTAEMASTTIFTVQHEPEDWSKDMPPEKLAIVNMNLDGQQLDTALKYQSQFLHVGCFSAPKSITMDAEQDTSFDPNACVAVCKKKMKDTPAKDIIVAVSGQLCGCVNPAKGGMYTFTESDQPELDCNKPCKFFENTICGGEPDWWGLFREYDYQSLASAGAYDPWRKIWYTVVVVLERTVDPEIGKKKGLPLKGDDTMVSPERYYLHAMDKTTGDAAFQYQTRLPGLVSGIQYDLDSSRLIGILTSAEYGRVISPAMWKYYLISIFINATLPLQPNMSWSEPLPELQGAVQLDRDYLSFTGASAIISKRNQDTYVYTMLRDQGNLKSHMHYIYFVSAPDGKVLFRKALDFRIVQLFSNEKYGDISGFGYRYKKMAYVYLARIIYDLREGKKAVLWSYAETRPEFLAPTDVTQDFHLYPGGSCSEHLFNKSYSLFRNFSKDPDADRPREEVGTLLMEVDIRNKNVDYLCDKKSGCKNSMNITIPYAGIFNAEPRIPLSLAAPSLVYARFSIDGGYIAFKFDRATLKGATPVDVNNDIVPDAINYDTTHKGQFGCDLLFDKDSNVLLGPRSEGTYCEWISESEVRATLPSIKLPPAEVADSIFLVSDVIYTVPRIEQGEYSMAATGGIQLSMPYPLLPPIIVFTGEDTVDECSPVYFDAGDSYNVGGKPAYNWSLVGYTDLTMRPDRIMNATRMQLLRDNLANATKQNFAIFQMSSKELESAVRFDILLIVKSRWGLNVTKRIALTKLDYPAPMVQILGPTIQETKRPQELSLLATGKASKCPGIDRRLGYKWQETSGKLDLDSLPDVVANTKSLIIPPFVLEPFGVGDQVNIYNFTITCFVFTDSTRYATATVTVYVVRSKLFAKLAKEDRLLTRGNAIIMDARESQDVDYPTFAGHTFKGNFRWWCLGPGNQPCYPELNDALLGDTDNTSNCRTEINQKITSAGRVFSKPVFVPYKYCKWARGVLMGDTTNFTEGNYTMTVEVFAADGRTSRKSAKIQITKFDVPTLMLTLKDSKDKYPVTEAIRLEGRVESELPRTANPVFDWRILLYGLNNQWVAEEARQADLEGRIYKHAKFIYTDVSDVLDVSNQSRFKTRPDIPNAMIFPKVVKPSQKYKMRLILTLKSNGVTTYTDASFETAGLPPRPGQLTIDPRNGTMFTKRIAAAPDWKAEDLPLKYHFGYYETLGTEQIQMHFDTTPLPISQTTFTQLPVGDPSTNYSLAVFVDVISKFGAKTTLVIQIQSRPPGDKTKVINEIFDRVDKPGADPEQTVKDLNTILDVNSAPPLAPGATIAPTDAVLMKKIIQVLQTVSTKAPVTKQMQIQQAKILTAVIESGYKTMDTMDGLESMILNSAAGGLFSIQDTALMKAAFYAIGGVLPDVDQPPSVAAQKGGRRLQAPPLDAKQKKRAKPHRVFNDDGVVQEDFGGAELSRLDLEHIISSSFGREEANHPRPWNNELVVTSCPVAYCDWNWLKCVIEPGESANVVMYTCCSAPNSWTGCSDPPCWFRGPSCPFRPDEEVEDPTDSHSELIRRLQPAKEQHGSGRSQDDWEWRFDEDLGYGSLVAAPRNLSNATLQEKLELQLSLAGLDKQLPRELSARNVSRGTEPEAKIALLEVDEAPMLADVQREIKVRDRLNLQGVRADSRLELHYKLMDPGVAIAQRAATKAIEQDRKNQLREIERGYSQIITRSSVLRDTICKQALIQMTTSVEVLRFDTPTFVIWMGKTRNMSEVRPSLIFPDKFIVPPDTPDSPTADNPLTAFAYIYIEYKKNIYGWSDSAPPGNESTIITLMVMQANTKEIAIKNETDPIRVFSDLSLFSSAMCMFWDRFAPNTAGGAWSTRGVLNDGEGCLTTHLSDIALFIDGRIPATFSVDKAVSYYLEDIIDGPEGSKYNYSTLAVVGFIILLGTILALVGYIQDELIRERQRLGTANAPTHYLDGDGISAPLSVDDAIAYDHAHTRHLFLVFTLWKVILRDHALLGVFHYNAGFSRPQRILCLGVMSTSVLAVNAMIYGVPREYVSDDQWVPSGVISGLMSFPIFVGCIFMFASRPTAMRKRLIKRATNHQEIEAIAKVREDMEHESAKLYPKGPEFPALPQYPMPFADVSKTSLLALPGAKPTMPSIPPPGMLALPPPPRTQLPVAGLALGGLPQIPPLPALKPGPGLSALPPPPKYQPPMARLTRAGLPEPGTRALPAPAPPVPEAPAPTAARMAVEDDGELVQKKIFGARVDGGETTFALPDPVIRPAIRAQLDLATSPAGFGDTEMTAIPGSFAADGSHNAPPPEIDMDAGVNLPERRLQTDGEHGMFSGQPALPELQGAPSGPPTVPPLNMAGPSNAGGLDGDAGGFCTPRTPPQSLPPSTRGMSTPLGFSGMGPMLPAGPPPPSGLGVQGISMGGIVHRGEPVGVLPPPAFAPGVPPPRGGESLGLPPFPGIPPMLPIRPPMGFGLPPGMPPGLPPGMLPHRSMMAGLPGAMMVPGSMEPQPPPPPPPKEDDAQFLRRARLHYMERAAKQHQDMLIDHGQDAPRDIPNWIFTAMTLCPYSACAASICCHIGVTLVYSMKFQRIAERYWYFSSVVGMCIVLIILELMRAAVMTIVELRKFEIRRRLIGGDYNKSRIKKQTADTRDPLQAQKNKRKPAAVPQVPPKRPPHKKPPPPPKDINLGPPQRDDIDEEDLARVRIPRSIPRAPSFPTPGGQLPVGPGQPPPGRPPAQGPPGIPGLDLRGPPMMAGTGTPGRGGIGQVGGGSLMPGKVSGSRGGTPLGGTPMGTPPMQRSGPPTPTLGQSFGSTMGQTPPPPPTLPPMRGGGPSSAMSKKLSDQMAANRASGAAQPPAPTGSRGPTPPGSHRSGGSGSAKPPTGPPPSGSNIERARAGKRGQ